MGYDTSLVKECKIGSDGSILVKVNYPLKYILISYTVVP